MREKRTSLLEPKTIGRRVTQPSSLRGHTVLFSSGKGSKKIAFHGERHKEERGKAASLLWITTAFDIVCCFSLVLVVVVMFK